MITITSPLEGARTGDDRKTVKPGIGEAATVALRELPGMHMLDLRVAPGSAAFSAVTQVLGFEPGGRGEAKELAQANALGLAPDWWLLLGCEGLVPALTALRARHHISVVDVSDQRTTIELTGTHAREVLAHVWEQDLREKSFPVSGVSQGLVAKAPVIVWHAGPSQYRILVRSSFAVHAWKVLVDAAEEYLRPAANHR